MIGGLMVGPLFFCGQMLLERLSIKMALLVTWPVCLGCPFLENDDRGPYQDRFSSNWGTFRDKKWWSLTANGTFSVKSFYNFLNDWGMRCLISSWFWHSNYQGKINVFNWLAWKNKILSLENLAKRRCNRLLLMWCATLGLNMLIICSFTFLLQNMFGSILLDYSTCLHLPNPCI